MPKGVVIETWHVHPYLRSAIDNFIEKRNSVFNLLKKEAPLSVLGAAIAPGGLALLLKSGKRFGARYAEYQEAHDQVSNLIFKHRKITHSQYSKQYRTYDLVKKYPFVSIKEDGSLHFMEKAPSRMPLWMQPLISKTKILAIKRKK